MCTRLTKGTPVVDIADGKRLGVIDAVYFDPERKEVAGFSFHRGGLFGGRASGLVDLDDVHGIGPDAVTVRGGPVYSQLAVEARGRDLIDLDELIRRPVVTEGGEALGRVSSVRFAPDSHALLALDVVRDGDPEHVSVEAERVITMGGEVVVVTGAAAAARHEGPVSPAIRVLDTAAVPERLRPDAAQAG